MISHTRIDFFDDIEIGFVVCILDATSTPWNSAQLPGWQCSAYTVEK